MAKHLREIKDMAQKEREEKEMLQMEVARLTRKEKDLKEREELLNSLLRNDMQYKTPPLAKISSQYSKNFKAHVDTSGYNTRPVNIINSTSNYYSRKQAVPYFENSDFSMLNDSSLPYDEEAEVGGETSRLRKLQNDR